MQDGRIARQHHVGSPYEEDLKAFRDSEIGQAILSGGDEVLDCLDAEARGLLQKVLQGVE
jgi:hypothetical protein